MMTDKFSGYPNFHIVNSDFETYEFEKEYYDLVYSAATIQWIPEKIAFSKTFDMLKPGGYLAMFMTRCDRWVANPGLAEEMDKVYDEYFVVKQKYTCKMEYKNALNYGFSNLIYKEWKKERVLNAEEFCSYIGTHCDHINLEEPYRSKFYGGIREEILKAGDKITLVDTIPLYLVQKP